jgi:MFS family permease
VTETSESVPHERTNWRGRLVTVGVVLAVLAVVALLASAFLPRWWAHRIGAQADGSFTSGILLGLFYGFLFTAIALLVLRWTFGRRRAWKIWAAGLIVALLLVGPNLLTLGIVLGGGNAAHAGERTLDVEAPGFRNSTLAGVLAAVAAIAGVEYLVRSRRLARSRLARLEAEQSSSEQAAREPSR